MDPISKQLLWMNLWFLCITAITDIVILTTIWEHPASAVTIWIIHLVYSALHRSEAFELNIQRGRARQKK